MSKPITIGELFVEKPKPEPQRKDWRTVVIACLIGGGFIVLYLWAVWFFGWWPE